MSKIQSSEHRIWGKIARISWCYEQGSVVRNGCENDDMRTTIWKDGVRKTRCEKDVVRKKRCEKGVVRMKRYEKDVVKKTLWESRGEIALWVRLNKFIFLSPLHFIMCEKSVLWSPHFNRWLWFQIFLSCSYLKLYPSGNIVLDCDKNVHGGYCCSLTPSVFFKFH